MLCATFLHRPSPAPPALPPALLRSPVRTLLLSGANLTGISEDPSPPGPSQLQTLDLSNNPALTGPLPPSWGGRLPAAACLQFGGTGLCGPVPAGMLCFDKSGTNLGERRRSEMHFSLLLFSAMFSAL